MYNDWNNKLSFDSPIVYGAGHFGAAVWAPPSGRSPFRRRTRMRRRRHPRSLTGTIVTTHARPVARGVLGVETPPLQKSLHKNFGLPFCWNVEHVQPENVVVTQFTSVLLVLVFYKQINDHDSWFSGCYLAGFSVEMILIAQTVLFILIFVRPLLMSWTSQWQLQLI